MMYNKVHRTEVVLAETVMIEYHTNVPYSNSGESVLRDIQRALAEIEGSSADWPGLSDPHLVGEAAIENPLPGRPAAEGRTSSTVTMRVPKTLQREAEVLLRANDFTLP
jgi:hypothetical protein